MINFDDILIQSDIIEVLSREAVINIKPVKPAAVDSYDSDPNVWIDYIEMVPAQDTEVLRPLFELLDPYDHSARYLANCTGKSYFVE